MITSSAAIGPGHAKQRHILPVGVVVGNSAARQPRSENGKIQVGTGMNWKIGCRNDLE